MNCRREIIWVMAASALLTLTGCAQLSKGFPASSSSGGGLPPCEPDGGNRGEIGVRYDAIREMMDDGRPRAALSHIEALENEQGRSQRSQLWRAQALRRIGHLEVAGVIYRRLTQGCLASEAYHGLGKVAGEKGDWIEAEQMLTKAVRLDPISPRKHNDLGYAQLKTGASDLAIEEFRTALELDPGRSRSANNLVLALLIAGEGAEAEVISRRLSLGPDRWQALQSQADGWEIARVTSGKEAGKQAAETDELPTAGGGTPLPAIRGPESTAGKGGNKTTDEQSPESVEPSPSDMSEMSAAGGESSGDEPEKPEQEDQP